MALKDSLPQLPSAFHPLPPPKPQSQKSKNRLLFQHQVACQIRDYTQTGEELIPNLMQGVSEYKSVVFCGAAARLRRAAAPC
jgi:hypothetical protein